MKYFNTLRLIAQQRQTGYTTAIASMKQGVIVTTTERAAALICRIIKPFGISVIAAEKIDTVQHDPTGRRHALVPDNQLLYFAVAEADEEMRRLTAEMKKKDQLIFDANDWVDSMTTKLTAEKRLVVLLNRHYVELLREYEALHPVPNGFLADRQKKERKEAGL
jgi:uncharacterized membrane protein YcgQ (UPF0703/DUF1980 family)